MSPIAGFAALVLAAMSISLGVIAAKQGYSEGADPQSLVAIRLLVAAPCVALALPYLLSRGRPIGMRAAIVAMSFGALIWISVRAELEGLFRLPAGALAVLLATAPIFVALLDWIVFGRRPSRFECLVMLTVVGGVGVMAAPVGSRVDLLGVFSGLVSALAFASFLFALGRNPRVSAAQALPLAMVGAAVVVVITDPAAVVDLGGSLSPWLVIALGVSGAGWALLLGVGLGATTPVTAAMVVAVEPVLVAGLAYLILGELLSAREVVGGLIVVGALSAVAVHLYVAPSQERS